MYLGDRENTIPTEGLQCVTSHTMGSNLCYIYSQIMCIQVRNSWNQD